MPCANKSYTPSLASCLEDGNPDYTALYPETFLSMFVQRQRACVWTKRAELLVPGVRKEDTLLWISRRFAFLALGHRGSPAFCPDLL
ncbi:hypothetical protein MHYP_G00244570 [Metynnis hypsauchen]